MKLALAAFLAALGGGSRPSRVLWGSLSSDTHFWLASPKFKKGVVGRKESSKSTSGSSSAGIRGEGSGGSGQGSVPGYDLFTGRPLAGPSQGSAVRGAGIQGSGNAPRVADLFPLWPVGLWSPQQLPFLGPPSIQASFDGNPDRIALFLSQVISHFDLYGRFYPSQGSMVVAVTTVLMGEVADWVADLHREHARELTNIGMFLEGLRARFEDNTRALAAEGEIISIK